MARPKSADEPKHFDVAKPGTAKPSASSRPIIVSSGPIMKDPMVNTANDADTAKPGAPEVDTAGKRMDKLMQPSKARITVTPPSQAKSNGKTELSADEPKEGKSLDELAAKVTSKQTKPQKASETPKDTGVSITVKKTPKAKPEAEEQSEAEEQPAAETDVEEAAAEDNTITPDPPQQTDDQANDSESQPATEEAKSDDSIASESDDDKVVDAVAKQAAKKENPADRQQQIYQDKVNELVASRKYNVPVGHLRRRRHVRNFLIVLVILLFVAAIGANFAMDGGMLHIDGVEPLTDVIGG